MHHRRVIGSAAALSVSALVAGVLAVAPSAGAAPTGRTDLERGTNPYPTLDTSLHDDVAAGVPVSPAGAVTTGDLGPAPAGTPVTVVVESEDDPAARAAVESLGGTVEVELPGRLQARVPATSLVELSRSPGVTYVTEPVAVLPAEMSEGVGTSGASAWQGAGWVGTGVKVAVIDVGFAGHAERLGVDGELGDAVTTDFSRCQTPLADAHGTAVAEIVHDVAPASPLHLVCVDTELEFAFALTTLAALGVRVVNGSIGIVGVDRGDGTGDPFQSAAGAVRNLRRQGILYVASAGNYGESHWHGSAVGDTVGINSDYVDITADDRLTFTVPGDGIAQVTLQWDEWASSSQNTDFDLYVGASGCPTVSSRRDQRNGGSPMEILAFQNCSASPKVFSIQVNRFAGTATPRMDVYLDGATYDLEAVTGSSMAAPATSEAVLSVGAHCFADGSLRSYSSLGPTIDGRIEPDISGPDGTTGTVYGAPNGCEDGFTGTSASAPHVAGAAALLLGANPDLDVAELQHLLVSRAVDSGPTGRDNSFGAGRLALGAPGAAAPPAPLPFSPTTPVRLYDTRTGVGLAESPPRAVPVGPGEVLEVPVRAVAGVPDDAVAVALNVTATAPTANAHLTVQPDTGPSTTSNLNFRAGQTVAQHVTATVGSDGRIRIVNAAGHTHVVVDLTGWYGPTSAPGVLADAMFNALPTSARAFDSRAGAGYAEVVNRTAPLASTMSVDIDLDLPGGIPAGATAAVVNVTAVAPAGNGYLSAYPAGVAVPATSTVNFRPGQTVANLAVVPLSADGRMRLRAVGTTHAIVDVIGWFEPGVGAGYIPLVPTRIWDSRSRGLGLALVGMLPNALTHLEVGRYSGIPVDAEAVLFGVTAVTPQLAGHLLVYPRGRASETSSLNFTAGATVPNAAISGMNADGYVTVRAEGSGLHLVVDVAGYFLDPANVPVPLVSPP